MNAEQAKALRAEFLPGQIGKLPRAANKAAKDANRKGNCSECGKYHVLPAVHLDFVGHAAITDRFLQVDPDWTWEPMAVDERGLPLLDRTGGLWIRLTLCGVTRPGYGDETNGKGMKEIIGDALRNAGMRFGVGLDLWSKEVLTNSEDGAAGEAEADAEPVTAGDASPAESPFVPPKVPASEAQIKKIHALIRSNAPLHKKTELEIADSLKAKAGVEHFTELEKSEASEMIDKLTTWEANGKKAQETAQGELA